MIRSVDPSEYVDALASAGMSIEDAWRNVVGINGAQWLVDDSTTDLPRDSPPAPGPGTELTRLLARVGITSAPDCACRAHAAEMDRREQEAPGWCAANIDTIVGWLREQATARGLPFVDAAGKMLIRRAIRNAARLTQ